MKEKTTGGPYMKTAIYGVWHVHAPDYTRTAQKYGEVVGFYEPDDALVAAFAAHFEHYFP